MKRALEEWAGALKTTIALVFTDIVDSTTLANRLGEDEMSDVRGMHFARARRLIAEYGGYEIKTIGDSFMVVFRTAMNGLSFGLSLHEYTGDERVKIRTGIHVGPIQIERDDINGKMVNFTSRLVSWPKEDWIILSDHAKVHVEDELGPDQEDLDFTLHLAGDLKGFSGTHKIWRVQPHTEFPSREIATESLMNYLHSRFPDREQADATSVSVLAEQLKIAGYTTIGDIERAIKKGWKAFLHYEPRRFIGNALIARDSNQDTRLSDVGAIRSLFYIIDEKFRTAGGDHFSTSRLERIEEARGLLKE